MFRKPKVILDDTQGTPSSAHMCRYSVHGRADIIFIIREGSGSLKVTQLVNDRAGPGVHAWTCRLWVRCLSLAVSLFP